MEPPAKLLQTSMEELNEVTEALRVTLGIEDPIEDVYPLSPVQEAMFFESLESEDPALYLVQQRIEIHGPLDPSVFEDAWNLVVARHSGLRTVLVRGESGPVQVVCRHLSVRVQHLDLRGHPEPDRVLEERLRVDRASPFALGTPPLMRIVLARVDDYRHELLLSQPHHVQDGWSGMVVLGEVFAAHEALLEGEAPALDEVRPVRDFIEWLDARNQTAQREFWTGQLGGLAAPTRMVSPGTMGGGESVQLRLDVDESVDREVRRFARSQRVTVSAVLAAAVALVIGRYTLSDDVVFCIVTSGRPPMLPGVESMVGMFINTVPVRVQIEGNAPVSQLVRDVHLRMASLLQNEHSPLSRVQSWSELDPGVTLTDTLVAFGSFPAGGETESLSYRTVEQVESAGFPLSLTLQGAGSLSIGVHYDNHGSEKGAKQLASHIENTLREMAQGGDTTVAQLNLLSESEALEATRRPAPVAVPQVSVHEMIADQVERSPDATALEAAGTKLSYRQLDERANRLANHLRRVGFATESTAAICLGRSLDLPIALLAVHRAGGAFVPLDPAFPEERLRHMTEVAGAELLITTRDAASQWSVARSVAVVYLDEVDLGGELDSPPSVRTTQDALAHVFFTSGSTGRPKGVAVDQRALSNCLWSMCRDPGLTDADRVLAVTTPTFDPILVDLLAPLMVGATVVIPDDDTIADPRALAGALDRHEITVMFATPSRWHLLESSGWAGRADLRVLYGGEAMPLDLAAALLSKTREVWNLYGTTETTIWSSTHRVRRPEDVRSIGNPLANTWFYILDHHRRAVPRGVTGRLFIAGVGVGRGYLGQPEETAERFLRDPFATDETVYDTGDLARQTSSGIELLGRADNQVKVRGQRIELGEIENALLAHQSVDGATVVVDDQGFEKRLVAYCVARDDPSPEALKRHVMGWLPDHMLPHTFVFLDRIPLTASGKVDRKALPRPTLEGDAGEAREPVTAEERLLVAACADLLQIDRVDLRDNFFDLGGHSLLAMRLASHLRERTGVRVDPRMFVLNTLYDVAATLSGVSAKRPPPKSEPRAKLEGCYFGPDEHLFGIHHVPSASTSNGRAVLVCPPYGWEYTHSHWSVRRFAQLASRAGFHVLRFDYSSMGDSWGDGRDVSLGRWMSDMESAADEVTRRAGTEALTVVGLRLGATVASMWADESQRQTRLVLWDPVVSGAEFLRVQANLESERLILHPRQDRTPDHLIGSPFPDPFRDELSKIDLNTLSWRGIDATVFASEERASDRSLVAHLAGDDRYRIVPDAGRWHAFETLSTIVHAAKIPAAITRFLAEEA